MLQKIPQWYVMAMRSMRKQKLIDWLSCKISKLMDNNQDKLIGIVQEVMQPGNINHTTHRGKHYVLNAGKKIILIIVNDGRIMQNKLLS